MNVASMNRTTVLIGADDTLPKVRSALQIGGVHLLFYLENCSATRIFLIHVISFAFDINFSTANRARFTPDSKTELAELMQVFGPKLNSQPVYL